MSRSRLHAMSRVAQVLAVVLTVVLWLASDTHAGQPQMPPQDPRGAVTTADPIKCWWRTTAGAVRMGEPFTLVLTCAVIDNDETKVVPDESRLDPAAAQFPPFDVLGGRRGSDLRSDVRRFLQYEYTLRLLSDDMFGKDVKLPPTSITYRVRTRTVDGALSEGRDLTYELPSQSVRVLSLVPDDTADIREGDTDPFENIDSRMFRATALKLAGGVFLGLGALAALAAIIRLVRRYRVRTPTVSWHAPSWMVRRAAGGELARVRQERQRDGWTPELADRALIALRVLAAYALSRPVTQALPGRAKEVRGAMPVRQLALRPRSVFVSSAVTARDVAEARTAAAADGANQERLQLLEGLETALARFSALQYGREGRVDEIALDEALSSGQALLRRLHLDSLLRFRPAGLGRVTAEADTSIWSRS